MFKETDLLHIKAKAKTHVQEIDLFHIKSCSKMVRLLVFVLLVSSITLSNKISAYGLDYILERALIYQ